MNKSRRVFLLSPFIGFQSTLEGEMEPVIHQLNNAYSFELANQFKIEFDES